MAAPRVRDEVDGKGVALRPAASAADAAAATARGERWVERPSTRSEPERAHGRPHPRHPTTAAAAHVAATTAFSHTTRSMLNEQLQGETSVTAAPPLSDQLLLNVSPLSGCVHFSCECQNNLHMFFSSYSVALRDLVR